MADGGDWHRMIGPVVSVVALVNVVGTGLVALVLAPLRRDIAELRAWRASVQSEAHAQGVAEGMEREWRQAIDGRLERIEAYMAEQPSVSDVITQMESASRQVSDAAKMVREAQAIGQRPMPGISKEGSR